MSIRLRTNDDHRLDITRPTFRPQTLSSPSFRLIPDGDTSGQPLSPSEQSAILRTVSPADPINGSAALQNQLNIQRALMNTGSSSGFAAPTGMSFDPTQPNYGIKLDPSRAYDVGYIKQIMQETAAAQGHPPPTQADYDYWIPKILAIGGKGLDDYWLNRLLTPDTGGAGGGGSVGGGGGAEDPEDSEIADEIKAIMADPSLDDAAKSAKIQSVLKAHGRPSGPEQAAAPAKASVVKPSISVA
jgi:hypothetical protein